MRSKILALGTVLLTALSILVLAACVAFSIALFVTGGAFHYFNPSVDQSPAEVETAPAFKDDTHQSTSPDDLESIFNPFWQSWTLLHDNYLYQPIDDEVLLQGAIEGLKAALEQADLQYTEGEPIEGGRPISEISLAANTPENLRELFQPFWKVWQFAETSQLPSDLTYQDLEIEALHSMVRALGDPYTSYMTPSEYAEFSSYMNGEEYEGIGAWVDSSGDYLTITSPMPGSPAEKAGLRPRDQIIGVDGEDMTGVAPDLVLQRVLGPAGTKVVLTIKRDGDPEPFDVEIIRQKITTPTVIGELREDGIAYIRLTTFGIGTPNDLESELMRLLQSDPVGIILDIRFNGGGLRESVVDVVSLFIDNGVVLYQEYANGDIKAYDVKKQNLTGDIPMIVLVNEATISAAEVAAGALQDHQRAIIVGETTFGKGVVQGNFILTNSQGVLKVTVSHWLTPNKHLIHEVGLEPDIVVKFSDEDIETNRDAQLEKAVELLLDQK
jgi:carboxyl-terminal processing protease